MVSLRETGDPVICDIDAAVVDWLLDHDVVDAYPARGGGWELSARRKVGAVRVGGVTVWVKPKIQISRIVWMLGWATKSVWQPGDPLGMGEAEDLVPALAEAFCRQAERALQQGLLRGYRGVEADLTVLRGRVRTADQLRRRFGIPIPLAVRYHDHLADIPENQLLRAAATRLLRLPGIDEDTRGRLRRLRGLLDGVADLPPRRPPPRWNRSRLNARYHQALALAEIVLSDRSFESSVGTLSVDGFLVDMYQLYEDFVTAVLSDWLERIGGRSVAQHRYSLDEDGIIAICPDLIWKVGERVLAVIDAKYKAERVSGFPQADVYQAVAYATAYGLDQAHLIYAQGNEAASTWTVRNAGVKITAHTLDLGAAPQEILEEIRGVAQRVADGLTPT
jgi:5-methylcytosine-specific restriction enzyme subunit McrC